MAPTSAAFAATALIVLLLPCLVLSQDACSEEVLAQSGLFGGIVKKGAVIVDHSSLASKGRITRMGLYFSKSAGCLKGAKAAFGSPPTPGIVGSTAEATEHALKLEVDEYFTKAEYKANQCVEYLKLATNKGREVSAGRRPVNAAGLETTAAPQGGQLLAIRGIHGPGSGDHKPGFLQQLELIWGTTKCSGSLLPESGTLAAPDDMLAAALAAPPGSHPAACRPRVDMCNEKASMNAFTYCVWNPPYASSKCRGGCCISSGKCASSSCAISGMGRDVPNIICYGVNHGVGFGGHSNCAGLACKLATPGCTTDTFGGNCVGTVVPFGSLADVAPESTRLIGAACLDATPSDATLDVAGNVASGDQGIYMNKLWTVCDCSDGGGGHGLSQPAARLFNLTTTRISNFTKNEVLAAFSTLLPQKDLEGELSAPNKPATLLPSFANMFKLPSLSAISLQLPSLLGNITASKNTSDGSLPLPKLPQSVKGLLQALTPTADGSTAGDASAATQPDNMESATVPSDAATEFKMVPAAPGAGGAESKPAGSTLGGLLKNILRAGGSSSSGSADGSSTGGATDASSSAKSPVNLAELLGRFRKAGPASPSADATPQGGGNTDASSSSAAGGKKPDLSAIGALIGKFINGPAAAAPAAAPAAANTAMPTTTMSAPQAATPTAPTTGTTTTPAAPIAAAQPAPAVISDASKVVKVDTTQPAAPGGAGSDTATTPAAGAMPGHIPGNPHDRPPTLAERIRQQKLAEQQAAQAGQQAASSTTGPAPSQPAAAAGPAPAQQQPQQQVQPQQPPQPQPQEAPQPPPVPRKRNGFSNMNSAAGQIMSLPGFVPPQEPRALAPELTAGVLDAAGPLTFPAGGSSQQLKMEQAPLAAGGTTTSSNTSSKASSTAGSNSTKSPPAAGGADSTLAPAATAKPGVANTPGQQPHQPQAKPAPAQQQQQQQAQKPTAAGAGGAAHPPSMNPAVDLAALEGLMSQLKQAQQQGGVGGLPAGLDLDAVQALVAQLGANGGAAKGGSGVQDVTALLAQMAEAVNKAADAQGLPAKMALQSAIASKQA